MPDFDPRTLNKCAFETLQKLSDAQQGDKSRRKEQKNQAQELYTYISTWGLMRLKAEEKALDSQKGKQEVVISFFRELQKLSNCEGLKGDEGVKTLISLSANDYLGLTGLAIELANEFGFWANAVYNDLKGAQ